MSNLWIIGNREATTILEAFKRFKSRMETITNKTVKNIRTDQGTEYKGEFLKYLENNGIVKQTGTAYEHTHPGQMERIHQTIMTMGRAMLKNSKLPHKYYTDAQLTAVYLYNRQVHGNDSKTLMNIFIEEDQIYHIYNHLVQFVILTFQLKEDQN